MSAAFSAATDTQRLLFVALSLSLVASYLAARVGLVIARATDRHLTYQDATIEPGPMAFGFVVTSTLIMAAQGTDIGTCIAAVLLGAIAMADAQQRVIPDVLVYGLAAIGIIARPFNPDGSVLQLTAVFIGILIAGYLMRFAFMKFRGVFGIGQGDLKLIAAIGANLPTVLIGITILQACLMAIAFWVVAIRRLNGVFAFGPFLAFACATAPAVDANLPFVL